MKTTDLHKAVTLYASVRRSSARADFGGGERSLATRFNHETEAGKFVFEPGIDEKIFASLREGSSRRGARSDRCAAANGRIFYPAKGNSPSSRAAGAGPARLAQHGPERAAQDEFCDPVQITEKGANNGGIWFDFNDAKPRDRRMGVFPAVPAGEQPIRGAIPTRRWSESSSGIQAGEWHHVVLNWQNLDTGRPTRAPRSSSTASGSARSRIGRLRWTGTWRRPGSTSPSTTWACSTNWPYLAGRFRRPKWKSSFRQPGLLASLRK